MNIYSIFFSLHATHKPYAHKLKTSATKIGPGRKSIHSLKELPVNNHESRKESGRYGRGLAVQFARNRLNAMKARK